MQEKQKVTLYIPPDLHRQLKIQSVLENEPMSVLAERAIGFYLSHPEMVEQVELQGQTHRIYSCPACTTPVVVRDGDLALVGSQPTVLPDGLVERVRDILPQGEEKEELVPC
jgi:hypothetical protein